MSEENIIACSYNSDSLSSDQRTETETNKHVWSQQKTATSDSIVFLHNLNVLLVNKVPESRL